jgi:hypothetical protein
MLVVIEQATKFVGEYIFSHTLGPLVDTFTNQYQFEFWWWSPWPGQWDYDRFRIDGRNVRDPIIEDGAIDLFLAGDIIYDGQGCIMEPGELAYEKEEDTANSQIVMSESAAACWINQFASSNIGHIVIDSSSLDRFWEADSGTYSLDTTSL